MSQKPAATPEVKNGFQIPKWAGKPPGGLHLDVMKEGKMIQKLMIAEKNCYFFGRNKDSVDFVTDHASCSRVHAALVWHKHLNRSFIIDLDSAHGTFIGSIKLDANKPQQVFIDSELKFGASTRTYVIRERPQPNKHFPSMLVNANKTSLNDMTKEDTDDYHNSSLNATLPESEAELDNLTEFNTAHNKRISQLGDTQNILVNPTLPKKKKKSVSICEDEDVINPEDIDPSIGRFRNMIQTTLLIPNKKKRPNQIQVSQEATLIAKRQREDELVESAELQRQKQTIELYSEPESEDEYEEPSSMSTSIGINLAPDVDNNEPIQNESEIIIRKQQMIQQHQQLMIHRQHQQTMHLQQQQIQTEVEQQQQQDPFCKKKYAKEAWPGRKPVNPADSVAVSSVTAGVSKVSPASLKTKSPQKDAVPQAPTGTSAAAPKRLLI